MQGLGCSITESSSSDQDALEATSTALESNLARLPQTWAWWTLRTLIVQQRMLSGLSSSIRSLVTLLVPLVIAAHFQKYYVKYLELNRSRQVYDIEDRTTAGQDMAAD